ncbi:uncharacterized protein TNCV_930521 [Trichonephila clavipes]|uniref:Uncharacterized protein n=1 Tax=Trichonephila clavipes TaxID=2585209 RepID=A0A8X7BCI4_TRICX|nr:uncharacterized protein TNCV_930521 [Trichonephila clavipes]
MDACKCKVLLRQEGTLNSRRATSPLVWLVGGIWPRLGFSPYKLGINQAKSYCHLHGAQSEGKRQNKTQFVRRGDGEKFHSDCVVRTVKHPTKIMIWSVISDKGTGRLDVVKGMMRQDQYKMSCKIARFCSWKNGF